MEITNERIFIEPIIVIVAMVLISIIMICSNELVNITTNKQILNIVTVILNKAAIEEIVKLKLKLQFKSFNVTVNY